MSPLAAVFAPLIVAYLATAAWIWHGWIHPESYYAHGPLLVLVAAFMAWAWRDRWSAAAGRVDPRAWVLLGPGLFAHLCGAALTIDSLSAASLCLSVPGAVWLAFGPDRLRAVLPIIMLLAFAVPLPMIVTERAAFELKEYATDAGLGLGNLLGVGAVRDGAAIAFPGRAGQLIVAAPCSGLRSLVSLLTLGYCVAFFLGSQRGSRRWILLGLAGPIALLSNVVRIAAICAVGRVFGVRAAGGVGHDVVNVAMWIVDLLALLAFDAWLRSRARRAS
jgi:exosortase